MKPVTQLKRLDEQTERANKKIAAERDKIRTLSTARAELVLVIGAETRAKEREAAVARGRRWKREHPVEYVTFMTEIRKRNQEGVIEGFLNGWWDLDENGDMAAPPIVFSLADFADVRNPLLAHVMAAAEIFPSVGQARKNGWNSPLMVGEWVVTKKKIRVRVEK